MERGDITRMLEAVSYPTPIETPIDETTADTYIARLNLEMTAELLALALERSKNYQWASVVISAPENSALGISALRTTMDKVSKSFQDDGLQTDEAVLRKDGKYHRQLTIFWGTGKAEYEALQRLGTVDESLTRAKHLFVETFLG